MLKTNNASLGSIELAIEDHDLIFWFGDLNYRIGMEMNIEDVFEKCAGINHDDGDDSEPSLDVAELTLAIDALYRRLEAMLGGVGKLPRVKEKAETILSKYDDNNDGKLDARGVLMRGVLAVLV